MNPASDAQPAFSNTRHGSARSSDRLSPSSKATARTAPRADGWTPSRIRTFLDTLAECGVVADAARAAGMSTQGAYAFRNSARGRAFDTAWRAALLLARRRLADEVMSRALNGCVEVIMRDGEVWGERHRFDNRLTMAVLTRLDALADSSRQLDDGPRRVAHEFEAFVDSVCAGGDEPAEFVRARAELPFQAFAEAQILERNAAYLLAREQGGEVEWQFAPDAPSPDAVAPGASIHTLEQNPVDPQPIDLDTTADADASGAEIGANDAPLRPATEYRQPFDNMAELLQDPERAGDEWQPSSSSTSLDSERPSEHADPGYCDPVSADPPAAPYSPATRTTPVQSHRANRVQPAARARSCVARPAEAASTAGPRRLASPYGGPG